MYGGAHGAIKLYLLLYTTCTRVQTVSHNPDSCTGEMTPSIQMYTPDGSTRTAVQPASLQMYSCAAGTMCAAHLCISDSFAMYSSTYYLAGSGLTFEIMCFGSNTGRDFNYHLPKAYSNPKIPSSRWTTHGRDKNLNRPLGPPLKPFTARLPQVVRLAHGFALASPADRTCK